MVKAEEKSRIDQGENGKIPEVDQREWVLGTSLLVTTKEEFVGPSHATTRGKDTSCETS